MSVELFKESLSLYIDEKYKISNCYRLKKKKSFMIRY